MRTAIRIALALLLGLLLSSAAEAQSAAANVMPADNAVPKDKDYSIVRQLEPTAIKIHDLVNIQITERTSQQANARSNRRRNTGYEFSFDDFVVLLSGLRLRADNAIRQQTPKIDVESLNNMQNLIQSDRTDRLSFSIQAEVADIKPNGNLVLEAHGTVAINNDISKYTLSGIASVKDIDPKTNTIKSERLANKNVVLTQTGPTRDAVKRGWLARVLDFVLPF